MVFSRGISTLVGETHARRYNLKILSRKERSEIKDEIKNELEMLEVVLKFDIHCIIIQAATRGFLLRKSRRRRRREGRQDGLDRLHFK